MIGKRSTKVSIVMVALVIVSILMPTLPQKANATTLNFGSVINVNDQTFGSMAASGDNVYLLWNKGKTLSDGSVVGTDVLFRKIKDDGSVLGSVINLRSVTSDENRIISNTDLAVYGNNVYVTWLEADIPSDNSAPKFDIFIKVSNDNGLTFSDVINLSNSGSVRWNYEILASDNNLYVTWINSSQGNDEVFFRTSSDNGATWNPVINLSNNAGTSSIQGQSIAVSGNNVYVVWQDATPGQVGILFRKSTDNGASFDNTINLGKKGLSYSPAIAAFGNNVYVAGLNDPTPADDSTGPELNFIASRDNGHSFGNTLNLSERAGFPKIAAYGSNVYVKWLEIQGTYGPWQIFFSRSVDNGASFDPAIDLSGKIYTQVSSEMAVYGNHVFATWGEGSNVIFRTSSDNGATFESKVNLSNGQALTGSAMYMSKEKLYVAWISSNGMSLRSATLPRNMLESTTNDSKEVTFANLINLSNDDAGIAYHEIAADGSYVYAVWSGAAVSASGQFTGSADIFFRASKDNGTTFSNVINLSKNSGNSIIPKIAVSSNNVYVIWQDDSDGDKDILFTRSIDNGATFSTPLNLSNDSTDSVFPQISVSSNSVYVVWQDGMSSGIPGAPLPNADILFRASTDNGAAFGNIVNLSKNDGYSQAPQIAVSGNNVYIVWYDTTPSNFDVFLARSTNRGVSFDNTINISKSNGFSTHPRIAVSGSNVYVIWFDDTNQGGHGENADIFFARSTDSGANFSDAITLWSNNQKSNGGAQIAAQSNNVYLVWSEGETNYSKTFDVFFVRSTDKGASFDSPVNLSNNAWSSDNPVIAVSGSNVYIAWQDNTPGNGDPSKNWDAFLRMSKDNGASFDSVINVSNNEGSSFGPKIALSGDRVYVAWMDNGVGNGDLLFAVGSTNGQSLPQIPTSLAPIAITSVSNPKPRWGLDEVTISGTAKATSLDTITIDWGDNTISNVRTIRQDGSWGPVSHTYDAEHAGKKTIVAKLFSGRMLKASTSYEIDVQRHATRITIEPISNLNLGSSITVTGSLFDTDAKVGITGRIVTFNATGIEGLSRTVTFKDGMFSSKGTIKNTVTALIVEAYFAGDELYFPSFNSTQNYEKKKTMESVIELSDVALVDIDGKKIAKLVTERKVMIESNIKNKHGEEQPLTYIVQIKDSEGTTAFISWIKGSLQSNQSMKAAVGWTPDASGKYTAEIFVWESVTNPIPLSEMSRIELTVR